MYFVLKEFEKGFSHCWNYLNKHVKSFEDKLLLHKDYDYEVINEIPSPDNYIVGNIYIIDSRSYNYHLTELLNKFGLYSKYIKLIEPIVKKGL